MPKINAPTVREHHERVLTSLIDAAEQVLRYEGPDQFTTSAVSARAGVARNSIYRYVDSVDDLRGLVVERYMPAWFRAVQEAMDATSDPAQQIVAWALTNLEQATIAGHGWLMKVGDKRLNQQAAETVNQAHQNMFAGLGEAWAQISAPNARLGAAMTGGLLNSCMKQVEAGMDSHEVAAGLERAVRALVEAFRS
ncbi:Transcriptional regulator [Propionibacterium freudenreichii]|nr:Transcriptional regulator [Propionibacterium freudenreichii]SCQ82602.1 Transcriptional regulator [Propionibacterium freudenreichii]